MESIIEILGVLGGYFAILLLLSVSVETILDPLKVFSGLRKQISPEKAYTASTQWFVESEAEKARLKATTLADYSESLKIDLNEVLERGNRIKSITDSVAMTIGLNKEVDEAKQLLVLQIKALQEKYDEREQKRITILRILSAIIGTIIAMTFSINSLELLDGLPIIAYHGSNPITYWGGIVLTGFATSAGSAYWHDKLDQIRALKSTARQISQL